MSRRLIIGSMTTALVMSSVWLLAVERRGAAEERGREASIEEKQKKGSEGVDFYYDLFGAAPGQDPQKMAEEVMKKDLADKPKVMERQRRLLCAVSPQSRHTPAA